MSQVSGHITKAVLMVALVCLLGACAKDQYLSDSPYQGNGTTGPLGIVFDNSVPQEQLGRLIRDLEVLGEIPLKYESYSSLATYVGVNDFSNSSLQQWLQARVKLVVGESFDEDRAKSAGENRSYNPQVISLERESLDKVQTVMFNLGAYLYLLGKEESVIYNLALSNGKFPIKSPRSGIIKIGEGLFQANSIPKTSLDSMANSLLRAAVFFHEARHCDGNGTNAAFPHAKCETGDYAGHHACENNLNGPYVVEAILIHLFMNSCTSCTSSEQTALQAFYTDNIGRLQDTAKFMDARAEALP